MKNNNNHPNKDKDNKDGKKSNRSEASIKSSPSRSTADKGLQAGGTLEELRVKYNENISGNLSSHSSGSRSGILSARSSIYVDLGQFLDFDDLLPMIGEFGLFQKLLFLFMIPFTFIAAFVYLGQIFMTLAPHNFYCLVPELSVVTDEAERKELSIPREEDGSFSHCLMYDANYTAIHFAFNRSIFLNSTWPTIPCKNGYVFDTVEMPFRTATMEFGWVCDSQYYATIAQMIFFLGSILGGLGYGRFADLCGRLSALVSSCFLALIGSLFTSITTNFAGFAATRLLVGASYDTCFTMIYILVLEYVGPKYRTFVANMSLAIFYAPFTMLMPWLALGFSYWRVFSAMCAIPICLSLLSFWLLPESARWLVSVGQIDNAVDLLKRVARRNNKSVPPVVFEHFKFSCQQFYKEELQGRSFTICSIFKKGRMARYMVLMILIWMAISLVYDGHVRAASVLDSHNVFVFFTIACATELPGNILVILTLDRFGRRWCAFVFTFLSGIFSLVAACMSKPKHMLGAALAGRFFANICYNIGLQWAAEVLPTVVRAQGVSFIHTMGYVSMLMSPPVVFLSQVSSSLMLIILGVLGLLGGILALFLPETLNHDLPQTLSDGAEFGREQRIWHGPCCGPGSKRVKRPQRLWHQGSSLRTISRDEFRSTKMHRVARIAPRKTHISSQDTLDTEKTIQTYTFEHAKN
ncbi:organic cation transporter protein [Drosophila pseudoobscura]|uniref:Organic cation transporter protein n=1 Tax=Drosophila pseudoobscura pseudoobscura TaxID=46245 RepID=Q29E63_DROPS|nr:organic cation transporter protein [Drosophila pseudoobscura]